MTPLEFVAHDIICICKYGSPGGSVSATELKRVTDYLSRLGQLPTPTPAMSIKAICEHFNVKPPQVTVQPPAIRPQAPVVAPPAVTIKLPGAP